MIGFPGTDQVLYYFLDLARTISGITEFPHIPFRQQPVTKADALQ